MGVEWRTVGSLPQWRLGKRLHGTGSIHVAQLSAAILRKMVNGQPGATQMAPQSPTFLLQRHGISAAPAAPIPARMFVAAPGLSRRRLSQTGTSARLPTRRVQSWSHEISFARRLP